jgi:hypothetical protein
MNAAEVRKIRDEALFVIGNLTPENIEERIRSAAEIGNSATQFDLSKISICDRDRIYEQLRVVWESEDKGFMLRRYHSASCGEDEIYDYIEFKW